MYSNNNSDADRIISKTCIISGEKRCYSFREDKIIPLFHSERRWKSPNFIRKTTKNNVSGHMM